MGIFEEIQELVNEELRKDEDRKINYLLTGEIPEEFKCPDCRERLSPEDVKQFDGILSPDWKVRVVNVCDSPNTGNK